jgi:hypothetical protein
MSVIIVHKEIPDLDLFKSSIKDEHIVIDYTNDLTEQSVIDLIVDKTNLAFVYHFPGYFSLPFFHDVRDISDRLIRPRKMFFSDRLLNLFTEIKTKNGSLTVDLLSCSLNGPDFIKEVSDIENELGIDIRFSVDLTGNKDGNWILESDTVDIKDYYFTADINNWNHVLTGAVSLLNFATYNSSAFTYSNNTCTLKKDINMADMSFNNTTQKFDGSGYFIEMTNNEIFDGSGYKITVNWENAGLFAMAGTVSSFNTAPLIKNLTVNSSGNIVGGGIIRNGQKYFKLNNCHSIGDIIRSHNGGICGSQFVYNGGKGIIENSDYSGDIGFNGGGGICGSLVGDNGGDCTVINCFSIGGIGDGAGGICGTGAGLNGGKCTVNNCYSIGSIYYNGGGIFGSFATNCVANNCFSIGYIEPYGGGFFGYGAKKSLVNNSYSYGNIANNFAGGIFGAESNNSYVFNSYCNGNVAGNGFVNLFINTIPIYNATTFNLIGITRTIDLGTQENVSNVNLDICGNSYNPTYWDISNTWFPGGSASTGEFQYPKLLNYMTNTSTKKLTIDSRLFKGLDASESNLARHKLLNKFYDEQTDDNNWYTDASNLGFYTNTYDKPIYKLYDTVVGSLNLSDSVNSSYGVYVNQLTIGTDYTIIMGANTYTVQKTNSTTYKLTKSDGTEATVQEGGKYTDSGYLIIFGSITGNTNTVGFVNTIFIKISNNCVPEIYKNKVFNNNGVLQFRWNPIEGAKYYIVNRYYGLCTKPEKSEKVTNILYSDNTWDKKQSVIRYNVEAVFDNKIKTASNKVNYFNN